MGRATGVITTGNPSAGKKRPRTRRAIALALATSLCMVSLAPSASGSSSLEYDFSGWLSYPDAPSKVHIFSVPFPATIEANLDWAKPAADLNLYLLNPKGTVVVSRTGTARPEKIKYSTTWTGNWRLRVVAKSGLTTYDLDVVVRPAGSPVATDDSATTNRNTAVTVSVLTNDKDPNGDPLTVGAISLPANGTATLASPGKITYKPNMGFLGTDSFTYEVCDSRAPPLCDTGTVSVLVRTAAATTMPIWAAEFMVFNTGVSLEQAVTQAKSFDIIASTKSMYPAKYQAPMREANPNLKLLVYVNAGFVKESEVTAYPEDWYARDALGNKIQSLNFGNYLMDPSKAGWVSNVVKMCKSYLLQSGYDGCILDMLGTAPLEPRYATGQPINPATGQLWTRGEWLEATTKVAAAVRTGIAPRPVYGNGLLDGAKYFDPLAPTERLMDGLTGGMVEAFMRVQGAPANLYPTELEWKSDVDLLLDAAARNQPVLAITKVWSQATQEEKDAWHKFALASFLLGNSNSYFSFRYDRKPTHPHPWWSIDLGSPTGPYSKVDGLYQRTFTTGKVVVNPTLTTATTSLGGTYVTTTGARVTSLTLPPNAAEILVKG